MENILVINNLDYFDIFNELELYIKNNKITCLSGSNNCGKTTLLRILSVYKYSEKETIYLNDKDISTYTKEEYDSLVQAVFPLNKKLKENKIIDELCIVSDTIDMNKIEFILKELNLLKDKEKEISKLTNKEIIKIQIACAIIKAKNLIIIDNLEEYFNLNEIKELFKFFKKCIKKYNLSFFITCINLKIALYSDELIIIKDGKRLLQGKPIEVLERDNIINKAGLELPFMIDLSVKLKDYDLIDKIELEKEILINNLWK